MIRNIIIRTNEGEFDYLEEGYDVEILEIFEDGIKYLDVNNKVVISDCYFEGENAIIKM